jgi:Caspase domain
MRVVLIIVLLAFLPSAAHAEKRIALLIGNKDYKAGVGALTNPLNDIRIVGDALKAVGFEVLKPALNARRADMLRTIHEFAGKLKAAGSDAVGFLYYSGHGVASAGENYLIPVDVEEPSTIELSVQGVKQSEVLAIVTSCCASLPRPSSLFGDPIVNRPAGTTTISGQLGQSLNVSLGFKHRFSSPTFASMPSQRSGGRADGDAGGVVTIATRCFLRSSMRARARSE